MQKNMVMTLTGHDRIGLVEQVSKLILENSGNIGASRMAHLGGEFVMLMFISVENDRFDDLSAGLATLKDTGYHITICETAITETVAYQGWLPFRIELDGADHEGIIHQVTHFLSQKGITVEEMNTNMVKAPMSGTPLFIMDAVVLCPADKPYQKWSKELNNLAESMNVDIVVSAYKG